MGAQGSREGSPEEGAMTLDQKVQEEPAVPGQREELTRVLRGESFVAPGTGRRKDELRS